MPRLRVLAVLAVLAGLLVLVPSDRLLAQTSPSVEDTHNALRALKDRMVDAVNKQNMDAIAADMAPDAVITTMSNDVLKGPDEFKAYIAKMFTGSSRLVDSLTATAEADDLSKLYADNQIAVATGQASAHFKLAIGKELDWPIRWSVTLVRQNDKWLITNAHFSANAIDNPLINASQAISSWMPWAIGVGGLVVGFVLSWLLRRRGKA